MTMPERQIVAIKYLLKLFRLSLHFSWNDIVVFRYKMKRSCSRICVFIELLTRDTVIPSVIYLLSLRQELTLNVLA